ncbi:hypothetical protein CFE70_006094 [Pyrenophora teres f. teres 0-1]|nr:hypothetical protein HRS9139_02806 [Pyrenophora teres f. teres]KAE8872102.1 hypothetical protein PTNB73_03561 [Pyrenophora teres f. teres]
MVVLVDLEDDEPPSLQTPHASGLLNVKPLYHSLDTPPADNVQGAEDIEERPNPNINGFSAALSCYPIVSQLAAQLDLNTLHDLSRTCRQFRANLLEYRSQLVKHTLHCDNEDVDFCAREGAQAYAEQRMIPTICARDMVGGCQRCGVIVCRNCTMKPPPTPALRKPRSPSDSSSPMPRPVVLDNDKPRAFTAPAFERICNCDDVVWLCAPCGRYLRNADGIYVRGWSWRTQYRHYLGGVGTGAGEGNEGVECGRQIKCLGARLVEHETCEEVPVFEVARSQTPETPDRPDRWRGTSYFHQEIEGIGGVLKIKLKKQLRVGECVKLFEDEKDRSIQYLEREVRGDVRSWCSWCDRVVLSNKDKADIAGNQPSSSGSSSTSSNT